MEAQGEVVTGSGVIPPGTSRGSLMDRFAVEAEEAAVSGAACKKVPGDETIHADPSMRDEWSSA